MTNFDRVKEVLTVDDVVYGMGGCEAIHRVRGEGTCIHRDCEDCVKWLNSENVDPIILTDEERTILENIDKKYNYIARDKDGWLYLYENKPKKFSSLWEYDEYSTCVDFCVFKHLFKFVDWKNEYPYNIKDLIKGV